MVADFTESLREFDMYAKLNGAKYCLTIASQCLALLFLLTGCVNDPEYKVYVLPSGKEIKIIGIKYGTFTDSDSLLILNYLTDIPIDNEKALRAEAEEIWPHFAVEVERANLTVGMLNAQTPSKKASPHLAATGQAHQQLWKLLSQLRQFMWEKQDDGKWKLVWTNSS